jgi:3-oxoacyl-[acyl-carrier-protein] synthase-3
LDRLPTRYAIRIAGTGSAVPERVVTNEELAARVRTTPAWILENLGIRERRYAAPDEYTSDLAWRAAERALECAGIARDDVDLIIVATATPDRKAPSTACLVKHKLGITNHAPAFDIAAVCSGFIYGLTLASQAVHFGNHHNVLVVGADTFSKITDFSRRDSVFFGDGAGAALVQRSAATSALFMARIHSETEYIDGFTVYPDDEYFTMTGRAAFATAVRVLPSAIRTVLDDAGLRIEDVSVLLPHQPSIRILHATAATLGLPFERVRTNMDRYANTSGATIPLLLDEVNRRGELQPGDIVLFAAVGAGWTWGAGVLSW